METPIKFTKEQVNYAISQHINSENGLNSLLEMVINQLMLSERNEFLKDQEHNKGNGFRPRKNSGFGNKLELRIPRDRMGVFEPMILAMANNHEERVRELAFSLYGKGLTTREISGIIEEIYGSSYSKSSISNITQEYAENINLWLEREIDAYYPVIFIDATHVKVRRDNVKSEAFYVVLGLKEDFTREVLAIVNEPTESAAGWKEVFQGLGIRGLKDCELFVTDGLTGIDQAIDLCFRNSNHQKCILHFQRNLNTGLRIEDREAFNRECKACFEPGYDTIEERLKKFDAFLEKWSKKYSRYKRIRNRDDLYRYFTFLKYDYSVQRMIYTTNWIERLNKSFKRTLKIRNALPNIQSVITLMGSVAIEMENKTYKYPIYNFKFEPKFNKFSVR